MSALLKYDAACRAIAEAKAVDEAKDLRDKAEAMRVYGRQAKNRDLEIDAAEIRMRAERRLGEMLDEQERTVGLNRGSLRRGTETEPRDERPTLAEVGIDKKLSARARKMAAVPAVTFERLIAGWRENVRAENERVTVDLLRHGQEEQQREARRTLARELSDASVKLTGRRNIRVSMRTRRGG